MCLDGFYNEKETKTVLAMLPDRMVVWKVAREWPDSEFAPLFNNMSTPFRAGRQEAVRQKIWINWKLSYLSGFHAYRHRKDAEETYRLSLSAYNSAILRCIGHKQDITAVGLQDGCLVLVFSHLTFPKKCGVAE